MIPGGRRSGGERGSSLQYSCLENPMDREARWATVHRVAKSQTQQNWSDLAHTHTHRDTNFLDTSKCNLCLLINFLTIILNFHLRWLCTYIPSDLIYVCWWLECLIQMHLSFLLQDVNCRETYNLKVGIMFYLWILLKTIAWEIVSLIALMNCPKEVREEINKYKGYKGIFLLKKCSSWTSSDYC